MTPKDFMLQLLVSILGSLSSALIVQVLATVTSSR